MFKSYFCLQLMFCIIYSDNTKQEEVLLPIQEYVYFSKDYKRVARHVEPDTGNVLFHVFKQLKRNYPGLKYLNSRQFMPKIISVLKRRLKKHYDEQI